MSHLIVSILMGGLIVLGSEVASSQPYPRKSIRIVTAAAGGGNDFLARAIAQGISGPLGQPVIVDNRGGTVTAQAESVLREPPDGYTLLIASAALWIEPLMRKTPYDPIKDFSPVTLAVNSAHILVVHPSVPVKTVKELIALAKARPGELNYAAGAIGSGTYLAAETFKSMAGINVVHIPYTGSNVAIANVMSGQVQLTFSGAATAGPHMQSGRLRALAVTSAKRSSVYPDLPTVAETVPKYETGLMVGLFASGKTPAAIINQLNSEVVRLLNQADVKQRFLNVGVDIVGSTPEQFAAIMKADVAMMSKIVTKVD